MISRQIRMLLALTAVTLLFAPHYLVAAQSGKEIYQTQCASCHGDQGEGVPGEYEEPLYGDRSIKSLTKRIHRSMPEDDPKKCVDQDAARVASYIYHSFYSPHARAKNGIARIELARLTNRQYENSVTDLVAQFTGRRSLDEKQGLSADYYKDRGSNAKNKVFDRIDKTISFDFKEGAPGSSQINPSEFSIRWSGSLRVEETGYYEFVLRTRNGSRVELNGSSLIDAWVSSGNKLVDHRKRVRLLGGRNYPISIRFFKYKEKEASIELLWKPPHKALHTIPAENLSPGRSQELLVVQTPFPPDDRSVGYERGTSVSKSWDDATTTAAIEVLDYIIPRLHRLAGTKEGANDETKKIKAFCSRFVELAHRRPLTTEEQNFYVDRIFNQKLNMEEAAKRIILLALKSPRFLYPGLDSTTPDSYTVAARLALYLWDSLPDKALLQAASRDQLVSRNQVQGHVQRMLKDERAKNKIRQFLGNWLEMDHVDGLEKDLKVFPGFDEELVSDLRTSLDLFLKDVVWSESSDFREFLLTDEMYVNDRLAKFYGLSKKTKARFEKVNSKKEERSGVLTHPYLLAAFSYPKSTSPIHRGVFLTRNIVGRALNPPPIAVEFKESEFKPSMTMREKVEELTRSDSCQNCHSIINPLGFSLENYDAVGRFRTKEKGRTIDTASDYTTDKGDKVRFDGARDLARFAASSEASQTGFIRQLFHHTVKQPIPAYGTDTMKSLHQSFEKSSFNIQKLLTEITILAATHELDQSASSN